MLKQLAQAKKKDAVLAEIKKEYPGPGVGHKWKSSNFNFNPPRDAWLNGLKPIGGIEVKLQWKSISYSVILVGKSKVDGSKTTSVVGSITDG